MSPAKSPRKSKHRNVATKGVKVEDQEETETRKWGCLWITGRVVMWCVGIMVLIFFGMKVLQWMDDIRFKMMDAKDVPVRFEELRKQGQMMEAYKLLQIRPKEEAPQIVALLMDDIDDLEAPFLFVIADRMYEEKPDEALFWAMLARMRLQYDMFRCADYKAAQAVFPLFMQIMVGGEIDEDIHDESKTRPMVQRVLDWDEEHPSTYNPAYICAMLTRSEKTIGEARWPAIHYRLIKGAKDYLATSAPITTIEDDEPQTPDPAIPGKEDIPVQAPQDGEKVSVPDDASPDEAVPNDTAPDEVAPDNADMNEMPEGVIPDEAIPDENILPEDNPAPEDETLQEDSPKEEGAE